MSKLIDTLVDLLPPWHSSMGRVIYSAAPAVISFFAVNTFGVIPAIFGSLVVFAVIFIWLRLRSQPPRGNAGRVAIAIAIRCETSEQQRLLDRDLVEQMRASLAADASGSAFQIIQVPQHLCIAVSDVGAAAALRSSSRAHLLVWGDIRTRNHNGQTVHSLTLEGVVAHAPIDINLSKQFSNEMRAILPRDTVIDCRDDLAGFQLASEDLRFAATYTVAIAAMLSMDFRFGLLLLSGLQDQVNGVQSNRAQLANLLPQRRADCLLGMSQIAHVRWRISRASTDIAEAERQIDLYHAIKGEDFRYLVAKGICDVVLRSDPRSAIDRLTRASRIIRNEPVCHYGLAFCHAVLGDLNSSYRFYRKAMTLDNQNPSVSLGGEPTAFEVEEFIEWYLAQHPECVQLHFCLGLLNRDRKKDHQQAARDFSNFLADGASTTYPEAVIVAQRFLAANPVAVAV